MASLSPQYQARAVSDDAPPIQSYRRFRSRSARGMNLSLYAMSSFEFGKKILGVAPFPLPCLLQALADAFAGIGASRDIEQSLIGFCVLYDCRGSAFHGEDYRAFALSELFHKIAGAATERGERLNILGDVQHKSCSY